MCRSNYFLSFVIFLICKGQNARGHRSDNAQPFGDHVNVNNVVELKEFPESRVFYEQYGSISQPFVVRNSLNSEVFPVKAYTKWTDTYLLELFGNIPIRYEYQNTDKALIRGEMPLRTFLKEYTSGNMVLKENLLLGMEDDVSLPPSLRCGGYEYKVAFVRPVMAYHPYVSPLSTDHFESIHCILQGSQTLLLVDKVHANLIEKDGYNRTGKYSFVDPLNVDLKKFPAFKDLALSEVHIAEKDCVFIPHRWHVFTRTTSKGRNLALRYKLFPMKWFNESSCSMSDESEPLGYNLTFDTNEIVRWYVFRSLFSKDILTWTDLRSLRFLDQKSDLEINELVGAIDINKDGLMTWQEISSFDLNELYDIMTEKDENRMNKDLGNEGFEWEPDENTQEMIKEDDDYAEHSTAGNSNDEEKILYRSIEQTELLEFIEKLENERDLKSRRKTVSMESLRNLARMKRDEL